MTATRLPLKSTPSCGHRPVWWQMPRKSFSPPIGGIIQRPVRIDPGTRIAVPVPDAADVGPGLEYLYVVTELAQVIELVEAGEPGADHQHVQLFDRFPVRRLCELR